MSETHLYDGDLPPHIIENLQRGVESHEKRVVLNLANVSRIVAKDNGLAAGRIRVYEDFVHDWEYSHSLFVKKGEAECYLCGKKDIREACHVNDAQQPRTIVVGNECVWKHIDIVSEGFHGLTGDAKRDYLKVQMGHAKEVFYKRQFMETMASAHWPAYHDYAVAETTGRREFGKHNATYAKRAERMIKARGYLTGKTKEWYLDTQPHFQTRVNEAQERVKRRVIEADRSRAAAAVASAQNNRDAQSFRREAEAGFSDGRVPSQLANHIGVVETSIRRYGLHGLKWSTKDFYDGIMACLMGTSTVSEHNEASDLLAAYKSKLTEWERGFLADVSRTRLSVGIPLSRKQQKMLDKVKKKVLA